MAKHPQFTETDTVGTRLRKLRLWREMTIVDLKDAANVSVGTISDAENDIHSLNTTNLLKLARALGVTLKQLTGA